MKVLRHWKVALVIVLIFSAGAVSGGVLTLFTIQRAFEKSVRFENWTEDVTAYLDKRLNLSPEQARAVSAIVADMRDALRQTVVGAVKESWHIMAESGDRIDQELTPEQRAAHRAMSLEFRKKLESSFDLDLSDERLKSPAPTAE